jgi:hypothetical protein
VCLNHRHRPDQAIDALARLESSDEQDVTRPGRHRGRPRGRLTKSFHVDPIRQDLVAPRKIPGDGPSRRL